MNEVGPEALDLLKVSEVAVRLRFSERTVWRLIAAERGHPGTGLESVTEGRSVRVTPEAVIAYKQRLRARAQTAASEINPAA